MKKKLLALAVAAALPISAQAGVTIYGKAHVSIDYADPDNGDSQTSVESRASRLGFKGSEDLGDSLKVIWKVESQVDMAGGGNTSGSYWKPRNAYIGLAGGFGTFLYGRHDTPTKMSTGKLDIFGDEMGDYNTTAAIIDVRADDAIAYVSPAMGGLTLAGAIVPDGDYDGDGDIAGGYSVAAMYSAGGLFLAGALESLDDLLDGADATHWRVGAGFTAGKFHIGGLYQDADDFGYDSYLINGSWAIGNGKIKAEWGQVDADDKTDAWVIGYDHNMSKRTKMYIQYGDSEHGLQQVVAKGTDGSGLSFGMTHSF